MRLLSSQPLIPSSILPLVSDTPSSQNLIFGGDSASVSAGLHVESVTKDTCRAKGHRSTGESTQDG